MPRPSVTGLVVAAIAAIGIAAALDALRGGSEPSGGSGPVAAETSTVSGPDVPPPGALPGRVVVAAVARCRLQVLDLADLTLSRPGPATACGLWPSPRGDLAAVSRRSVGEPGRRELWLVRLADTPELLRRLGSTVSPASWSRDGRRLAWCEPGAGTVVRRLGDAEARRLGGCYPVIAPDGSIVTRETAAGVSRILRNGRVLLDEEAVAKAFPGEGPGLGPSYVVGHGVGPDGVLVLAVLRSGDGFRFRTGLELWRGTALQTGIPIRSYGPASGFFGLRVEIGPDAREIAVISPDTVVLLRPEDIVSFVDLRSGRELEELLELPYSGLAWSPDGAWLALSTGEEILVYGRGRADPAYVLPVAARAIAWVTT